jgi:hypothetical protein
MNVLEADRRGATQASRLGREADVLSGCHRRKLDLAVERFAFNRFLSPER